MAVCLALTAPTAAPAQEKTAPAPAPAPAAPTPAPVVAAPAPAPTAAAPAAPAVPGLVPSQPGRVDRALDDDLRVDRTAQVEESGDSLIFVLLRTLLVLGLVLALVYVTLNWGLRKLMRISPARQSVVKVHERVALDAKKIVYLVEAGDEYMLLGAGEREVSFLTRLDAERTRTLLAKKAERAAPAPVARKPFWERLLVKPPPKNTPSDPQGSPGGKGGSHTTS